MSEQKRREQLLLDYLDALDADNFDIVSDILYRAEEDSVLAKMLLDIHDELGKNSFEMPTSSISSLNGAYHKVDASQRRRRSKQKRGQKSDWLGAVAAIVMTIFGVLLVIGIASSNDTLTMLEQVTPTAVPVQTPTDFVFITGETDCTTASIPEIECATLLDLFEATDGDEWLVRTGWNANNDPCRWRHVTCRDGHVVQLNLDSNRLSNTLVDLSGLEYLEVLDVSDNDLWTQFDVIGELPNLRYLDVSDNFMRGDFDSFDALPALDYLNMSGNGLSGVISPLLRSDSLRVWDISHNSFTGTLPNLSNFPALEQLNASHNMFFGNVRGLPESLNLIYLDISHNQITGGVDDLAQLTTLQYVNVGHNQMDGAIPDLSANADLETFDYESSGLADE